MTYRPPVKNKKSVIISLAAAVCAMLLIVISGIINRFGGLYQISAIILGVVAIELYMKYIGSDYVYELTDNDFKIYKITGKKSICVSSLDYEMSLSGVISKIEYLAEKERYKNYNFNVNFCKNMAPDDYSVYFFKFNGKKCMMKFEPDNDFSDSLNKRINKALSDADENYDG